MICVVTSGGPYAWIIANTLADHLGPVTVIVEQPEPMARFLSRRARLQGWVSVAGQAATMVLGKLAKRWQAQHIRDIETAEGLVSTPQPDQRTIPVPSINDPAFLDAVASLKPKVILLVGSRLMKADVLARLACPVLNYHAGITPLYRGMNGGYWALATGDAANFGATVHLVDAGVDTGAVIGQVRGAPEPGDSMATYAHRLVAMARPICIAAVRDALAGTLEPRAVPGVSRQWFHPPIWRYIWTGLTKGVW